MKIIKENWQAHGGWWVGAFSPTAYFTKDVEICHKLHPKGERWPPHFHKVAVELNFIIEGTMTIQGQKLAQGDVFVIEPGEIADPTFQTDCKITVVKIPSIPNDKYEV